MDYLRARAGWEQTKYEPDAPEPDAWPEDPVPAELPLLENRPVEPEISCETFIQQAEEAQARGDWAVAERIWQAVRKVLPQLWFSYAGGGVALAGLGRYDEARQMLSEGAVLFPHERTFPLEQARLAMRLSDWPAAEAHWRTALTFDIRPWWVYTELAGALEQQGRLAEAEAVLRDGQLRSDEPDEITLHTYAAELAWKRGDWAGAVARWAEARRRFPNDETLAARHQEALMRLGQSESLSTDPARDGAVPARG